MKINTDEQTKDLITKVKDYIADDDGWKLVKKGVSNHKTVRHRSKLYM